MAPREGRPGHINLNDTSFNHNAATPSATTPTFSTTPTNFSPTSSDFRPPRITGYMDLPSPRAGEAPPALSPLDAFAMQSRLLARRFEQDAEGRRVSRLPPVMVAKELSNRPGYFRSLSGESKMSDLAETRDEDAVSPDGQRDLLRTPEKDRPISHYPMLARASDVPEEAVPKIPTPFYDASESQEGQGASTSDYFGSNRRAASPEAVDTERVVNVQAPSPQVPSLTNSVDTISSHPRTRTNDSQRSQRSFNSDRGAGLAPPQSPRYPRSPRSFQSIRSVPPDSGDEDIQSGSQPVSSSRKFSGSSNMSRPQSPFSPWMQPMHRSPSMTSEYSMNGSQAHQPGPRLHGHVSNVSNFSRPISSSGRPSFDSRTSIDQNQRPVVRRQPSGASTSTHHSSKSALSRSGSGDDVQQMGGQHAGRQTPNVDRGQAPNFSGPSYVYAKYALPRQGPAADEESTAFRDTWIQRQYEWDSRQQRDKAANSRSQHQPAHDRTQSDVDLPTHGMESPRAARTLVPEASSQARSRSADTRNHRSTPSVKTTSTDRTIKAPVPLHKKSPSAELSPDEHLEIGITAHDAGHTTKSTYHLRLAAHAGLPTAMLLYALACRHGWGMRPNQEEGVKWLRKAIDSSSLSVADADVTFTRASTTGKPLDITEKKKRKAQYALAIYELGNSSMHGWGCAKDKQLALRCYEIAGEWGDADALAEAGMCYKEGVGCRKDLKKSAGYYRRAEKAGVRIAGNSWIWKEKYMPKEGEGDDVFAPTPTTSKDKSGKSSSSDTKPAKLSKSMEPKVAPSDSSKRPDTSHASKPSFSHTPGMLIESPLLDSDRSHDTSSKTRARSRSLWGRKRDKNDSSNKSDSEGGGGPMMGSTIGGRDGREAWLANNARSQQAMNLGGPPPPPPSMGSIPNLGAALGSALGSGSVSSSPRMGGEGGAGGMSPNPGAKVAAQVAMGRIQ